MDIDGPGTQGLEIGSLALWHFDGAAQTIQFEMCMREETTAVVLVQIFSGTFEQREPGVFDVQFDTFAFNEWETGRMHYEPPPEDTFSEAAPVRIQIDGDYLFFVGPDEADTDDTIPPPTAFLRFDCP